MSTSVFSTLSGVLTGKHPELGILCRETGEVLTPSSGTRKAHWTFGSKHGKGYRQVCIARKKYLIHRLIAETFLGEIPEGYEIDHKSRVRDDNRLENIRIVTSHENHINTRAHDRVEARGGTHCYEDRDRYKRESDALYRSENKNKIRECHARYYTENKEKVCEKNALYRQTHRKVLFADGKEHWVTNEQALKLQKLPVKERIYGK